MNQEQIKFKLKIGGKITDADLRIIIKDMNTRMETIEETLNELTLSGSSDSKSSKKKATTKRVSGKSTDDS